MVNNWELHVVIILALVRGKTAMNLSSCLLGS